MLLKISNYLDKTSVTLKSNKTPADKHTQFVKLVALEKVDMCRDTL